MPSQFFSRFIAYHSINDSISLYAYEEINIQGICLACFRTVMCLQKHSDNVDKENFGVHHVASHAVVRCQVPSNT